MRTQGSGLAHLLRPKRRFDDVYNKARRGSATLEFVLVGRRAIPTNGGEVPDGPEV